MARHAPFVAIFVQIILCSCKVTDGTAGSDRESMLVRAGEDNQDQLCINATATQGAGKLARTRVLPIISHIPAALSRRRPCTCAGCSSRW
jgi:hypothetical protein